MLCPQPKSTAACSLLTSVVQSACLAHNGDGSVAHGDHLCEAAGLKHGGHQEDVAAGVDEVTAGGRGEEHGRCAAEFDGWGR